MEHTLVPHANEIHVAAMLDTIRAVFKVLSDIVILLKLRRQQRYFTSASSREVEAGIVVNEGHIVFPQMKLIMKSSWILDFVRAKVGNTGGTILLVGVLGARTRYR
jgi:hypothetical protein